MTRRTWLEIAKAAHALSELTSANFATAEAHSLTLRFTDRETADAIYDRAEATDVLAAEQLAQALYDAGIFTDREALDEGFRYRADSMFRGALVPIAKEVSAAYAAEYQRAVELYESPIPF